MGNCPRIASNDDDADCEDDNGAECNYDDEEDGGDDDDDMVEEEHKEDANSLSNSTHCPWRLWDDYIQTLR